jgi:hypothetical protein
MAGRATPSASVLTLQRQIGNAAVTRLLQRDATADARSSRPSSRRGLVAFSGWREYRAGDAVNDSRLRPSFAPGGP